MQINKLCLTMLFMMIFHVSGGSFIKAKNGTFYESDSGKPFPFHCVNSYYLSFTNDKQAVIALLDDAARIGVNVIRTWAFSSVGCGRIVGGQFVSFPQVCPTVVSRVDGDFFFRYYDVDRKAVVYNDNQWRRLDFVLSAAKKRGIRLILTLENNWSDYGGADQAVVWPRGRATNSSVGYRYHADFFVDRAVKYHYIDHVKAITQRYGNDETVFAFELMNEARCDGSGYLVNYPGSACPQQRQVGAWIREMAAVVANHANGHMVCDGSEGFVAAADGHYFWNNGLQGYDWNQFARIKELSFLTFHMYPQHWFLMLPFSDEFLFHFSRSWIKAHCLQGLVDRPPVVLEEYGWHIDVAQSTNQSLVATRLEFEKLVISTQGTLNAVWMMYSTGYNNYDGYSMTIQSPGMKYIFSQWKGPGR